MKHLLCSFYLLFLVHVSQATTPGPMKSRKKGEPKNVLKINLVPAFFKVYSFQYERVLKKHFSFCVQSGFGSEIRLSSQTNRFMDSVNSPGMQNTGAYLTFTELYTTRNFYFTPEFRLYLKTAPKGLYLAPYYRLATSKLNGTFTYRDSDQVETPVKLTGNLNRFHPGVMLGYQRTFVKYLVLDLWILGYQFGNSRSTLDAHADFNKVSKEGFADFVSSNVKNGSASVTYTGNDHAAIRYTSRSYGGRIGVCIGFRF
jgi:hypothetical protein